MAEYKTIRLLRSIKVDNEQVDNNCVVDAATDVADDLIGAGWAEPTDAIERHPSKPRIDHYDTAPVLGTEVHPVLEGSELIVPDELAMTEARKDAQRAARADGITRVVPQPEAKLTSDAEVADDEDEDDEGDVKSRRSATAAASGPHAPVAAAIAHPPGRAASDKLTESTLKAEPHPKPKDK